jgi:TPR repeat protein
MRTLIRNLLLIALITPVVVLPPQTVAANGDTRSTEELTRAANDGDVAAMMTLGMNSFAGRGVKKDYSAAAKWFRKAADKGVVAAAEAFRKLQALQREDSGE